MKTPKKAHKWPRARHDWYVEEWWCVDRLFQVENFGAPRARLLDPACGWGTIPACAEKYGYHVIGGDIVDRRRIHFEWFTRSDFLSGAWDQSSNIDAIVCNPPFRRGKLRAFIEMSLRVAHCKVAMLVEHRALAAATWLQHTPLYRIYVMNPRPSMPPGVYLERGKPAGGGTQDFCWLVWLQGYTGNPEFGWLYRDGAHG